MVLQMALQEIWNGANAAFAVGPMLNGGAVHALMTYASDDLQKRYLPKLVSGEWMVTMDLTEPQAGSDLGAHHHPGGARRRWQLPPLRPEDLHHLRRPRPHRQHRPSGARPRRRRDARHRRHLHVPGAQGARTTARATTLSPSASSTSSACTPRRPARWSIGERRPGRHRLAGRQGESRPRLHVHHDEPRPPGGRRCRASGVAARALPWRSPMPPTAARATRWAPRAAR